MSISYFSAEDVGSSEVLVDLPQVTAGRAKAGKKVCLMPTSMFSAQPVVLVFTIF